MITRKICAATLLLIFSLGILHSCSKPQPVNFAGYRNVRFSNQGFSTGLIRMDVAFYNPNPFPMKIKETTLAISIDQEPFGEITQDSASFMPAKDTFLMPVSLRVNLVDLLHRVMNSSAADSLTLEAEGNCKIGRSGVFMNMPLHYQSKEIFKMF
jgi:LEA14-like dessication related protein